MGITQGMGQDSFNIQFFLETLFGLISPNLFKTDNISKDCV